MDYLASYTGSNTLYAFLRRKSDLYVQSGTAFVSFVDANIEDYAQAPVSSSGDIFKFTFPDPVPGSYIVQVYEKIGPDKSITDPGGSEEIYFTGTVAVPGPGTSLTYYGSVEGADIYFQSKLHSEEWFDFDPAQRILALQSATFAIDQLSYCDSKTDPLQPLEFPRNGETEVPGPIIMATYEEAFQLLTDGPVSKQISKMEVTSRQFSSIKTTYARGTVLDTERYRWGIGSPLAWMLLQRYFCRNRTVRLHRVS